jgi:tetratricopeptide (TPR) repeat protein
MLFDLRSRGRRRTVQVVYVGLAVLIGAGLVLFGVGTGTGGGGLLGGLTGSNSGSGGGNAVTSQVKKAVAQTKKTPNSAAAWANLINARFSAANSVGYDSNTSTYTAAGKQQLRLLTQAYAHYTALVKSPGTTTATLAAKAYSQLSDWSKASAAYQAVLQSSPGNIVYLRCVAMTSYAAKSDRVAQLAETRLLQKLPKSVRKENKALVEQAKTSTAVVSQSC